MTITWPTISSGYLTASNLDLMSSGHCPQNIRLTCSAASPRGAGRAGSLLTAPPLRGSPNLACPSMLTFTFQASMRMQSGNDPPPTALRCCEQPQADGFKPERGERLV